VELTIGVDVGGTKIAAGVVDSTGKIVRQVRVATPGGTANALDDSIVHAVTELLTTHSVEAVGVAAAGFVDEKRKTVRFAPNLLWRDRPLARLLGERLDLPVVVENDANAAAWAEFQFGAGHDVNDMVLITVGTGLGGGIVLDGRVLRGAWGIAAEMGHVRMVPGGLPCGCGQHGCWEQYASGRALVRMARELALSDQSAAAAILKPAGGDADGLEGWMVTAAAMAGDPAGVELLAELGRWLGEGIADVADVLDPAVVVIGGGVAEAGDLLLDPARAAFARCLSGGEYRPHLAIEGAALGNDAGIIGAADLARHP